MKRRLFLWFFFAFVAVLTLVGLVNLAESGVNVVNMSIVVAPLILVLGLGRALLTGRKW